MKIVVTLFKRDEANGVYEEELWEDAVSWDTADGELDLYADNGGVITTYAWGAWKNVSRIPGPDEEYPVPASHPSLVSLDGIDADEPIPLVPTAEGARAVRNLRAVASPLADVMEDDDEDEDDDNAR